jgi:transposase
MLKHKQLLMLVRLKRIKLEQQLGLTMILGRQLSLGRKRNLKLVLKQHWLMEQQQ